MTRNAEPIPTNGNALQPQRGCDHSAQGWRSSAYPGKGARELLPCKGWSKSVSGGLIQPSQGWAEWSSTQGRRVGRRPRANPGLNACHPFRDLCEIRFASNWSSRFRRGISSPSSEKRQTELILRQAQDDRILKERLLQRSLSGWLRAVDTHG